MKRLTNVLLFCFFLSFLLCFKSDSVRADTPTQKPAISFSPAVIDFGLVPSNAKCTQLVTVTFDRRVFSPDHLPTLVPDRGSQADVALFARFDDFTSIRVVYRVTINVYFQMGPFRDYLILVNNPKMSPPDPPNSPTGNDGVEAVGESVQGLEGSDPVDFGNVEVGKTRTKRTFVGFSAPNIGRIRLNRVLGNPELAFPRMSGLANTSVVSSSPDVTASSPRVMGVNASIFQTWTVTFRSHLPLGRMNAELQFKTRDGYYATVPVTAEVVAPSKPEPHTLKKH